MGHRRLQVGSRSETKLLETVKRAQGKVVGVLNQVDRLENEEAIERQKQEVWTHYGEMVKEVVTTSGKWLEEEKPQGNRQELLAEIEKIGSWSQEQRARKTARRVAAVAEECLTWIRLKIEEEKTLKDFQSQYAEAGMQYRTRATQLWQEAISHRDQLHKPRKDEEDRWWQTHCSRRIPLTLAYEMLLSEKLSRKEFEDLKNCLAVLEEANWHLSPHDPVPWREDFLIAWRQGNQFHEDIPEVLFSSDQLSSLHNRELLYDLIEKDQPALLERHHGDGFEKQERGKINEVMGQISKAHEVEEAWNWALNLKSIKPAQIREASVTLPNICGIPETQLSRGCAPLRRLKELDQFILAFEKLQQMVQESYRHLKESIEPLRRDEPILLDQNMVYSKIVGEMGSKALNHLEDRLMKLRSVQKNVPTIKADQLTIRARLKEEIKSLEDDAKQIDHLWSLLYSGKLSDAEEEYQKLKSDNKNALLFVSTFIKETKKDIWFGYFRLNFVKHFRLLPIGSLFGLGAFLILDALTGFLPQIIMDQDEVFSLIGLLTATLIAYFFPIIVAFRSLKSHEKSGATTYKNISYSMTSRILRVSTFRKIKDEINEKLIPLKNDLNNHELEAQRLEEIDSRIGMLENLYDLIPLRKKNYDDAKREFDIKKCSLLEQLASPVVEKEQPSIV